MADTGRPSEYTDELGETICELVADGSNLNKIQKRKGMPSRSTMYRWFSAHKTFWDKYTRARMLRADSRADAIDGLIDKLHAGKIDPQTAKVILDAQKWQASKEDSSRYGDKVVNEHTGKDGGPIAIKRIIVDPARD